MKRPNHNSNNAKPPQRFVAWDVSVPLPGAVDRSRIPSSAADRGRGRRVPDGQTLRSSWPCGGSRNVTARHGQTVADRAQRGAQPLPHMMLVNDDSTAQHRMAESICRYELTLDDNPTTAPPPIDDLVKIVVSMANRLCGSEGTPAGKGRRSQSPTCCRNRQGRQTNPYFAHHDVRCV
jgi:hypothetical protein